MNIAHRTLCNPPAPTSACMCTLPFSDNECIVTANGDKIQIFAVINDKLVLVWEKTFWAKIFGVFRHKSGQKYDSIIMGCDTNKVVVLQVQDGVLIEAEFHSFDIELYDISTRLRKPTMMACDPSGTCLAMLIAGTKLLFLPLARSSIDRIPMQYPKYNEGQHSSWDIVCGCIIRDLVEDFTTPMHRVRDIAFLEGYNRPTLAIMHELVPTWSARLAIQKSSVKLSIVSPSLIPQNEEMRGKLIMWTSRPLPHNSFKIVPVLPPFGGFIVLSTNAIIYMTHTSGTALGLNSLASNDDEIPFEVVSSTDKCIELFSGVATPIDPTRILITIERHKFAVLSLQDNGVDIIGLTLNTYEELEFHPSLILQISENKFFAGSIIHDSAIIQLTISTIEEEEGFVENIHLNEPQISLFEKFYLTLPQKQTRYQLSGLKIDVLYCLRQIGTVITSAPSININHRDEDEQISMVMGCGFRQTGSIQYMRCGITPTEFNEEPIYFSDIAGLFSSKQYELLIVARELVTDVMTCVNRKFSNFQYNELFLKYEKTVFAGDFGPHFVQVTDFQVRLITMSIDGDWGFADLIQRSHVKIIDAKVEGRYLVILFSDGLVSVYRDDKENLFQLNHQLYCIAINNSLLFAMQTNGVMRVYSLVDGVQIASFDQFKAFPDVVKAASKDNTNYSSSNIVLIDMNFLHFQSMTLLVMLSKEGPAFFYQWNESNQLFRRIKMNKWTATADKKLAKQSAVYEFTNINGHNGGYVSGSHPYFIIEENGYPRVIPISQRLYKAKYFTQLSMGEYHDHFAFSDENYIHVCNFDCISSPKDDKWLQKGIFLVDGCIVERIPIGLTPRKLTFAASWPAVVYLASRPIPFSQEGRKKIDPEEDLQAHFQQVPTPDRTLIDPDGIPENTEEEYSVHVLTENGETDRILLDRHEIGLCVSLVHVSERPEENNAFLSEYLVLGTGYMTSDQFMMRGKISIYKTIVTMNDDQKEIKLHELFNKIMANPVIEVTDNNGYIAAFIGPQLKMYKFFNENAIKEASFWVGRHYISRLDSLKNYILSVDAIEGYEVIRWRKYGCKLITMAKDCQTYLPLSGGFLTSGNLLGGVVFDEDGNSQVFDIDEYAIPIDALVRQAVFYINCRALNSGHFPIQGLSEEGQPEVQGHLVWYTSTTGKMGVYAPMKGVERNKLSVIQSSFEKIGYGFSHLEYRSGKFSLLKNQDLINEPPSLIIDIDYLLELLESPPEVLRSATKSMMRGVSDYVSVLRQVYGYGNEIFE